MAFAKAEALTMVCMKNRFWTLIATCIDKKDADKNPALKCGIFAHKAEKQE